MKKHEIAVLALNRCCQIPSREEQETFKQRASLESEQQILTYNMSGRSILRLSFHITIDENAGDRSHS